MSLSSLIVQREVATMRQVEEALARQVIYGGDLATNLLEVARIDEAILAPLLADSLGLPVGPTGELPIAQGSVRALVPSQMASQRSIAPLAVEDHKLVVAVSEPLPPEVEEQLSFALGMSIEQRAALAVRVKQAIGRLYALPLERRMERLLARMAGETSASGSMPPPLGASPTVVEAPRPPSNPPRRATTRGLSAVVSARPPAPPPDADAQATTTHESEPPSSRLDDRPSLQREGAQSGRAGRRRRGPLTLDVARLEAEEAADRDALLDLFFDFSRQFFEYAAIFLVHGDIAEGRDAFGTGASRDKVTGIGVPLDLPGLLSSAREGRGPLVARVPADGLDAVLLGDLQRPRDVEVAVVPLVVRTRAVAILLGDCGDAGVDRATMSQVARFSGEVGKAFERIIVRRKLDGFIAGSRAGAVGRVDAAQASQLAPKAKSAPPPQNVVSSRGVPGSSTVPSPSEKHPITSPGLAPGPRLLAEAAPGASPAPAPVSPQPPVAVAAAGAPSTSVSPSPGRVSARNSQPPPGSVPPPPAANITSLRSIGGPPIPREEPESPGVIPAARPVSGIPVVRVDGPRPRAVSAPDLEVLAPTEADAELFDELGWEPDADHEESPGPPPSSAIAVPLHAPASRHPSHESLPSIIVDIDHEVRALLERVIAQDTDEAAEGELLRMGERAMRVIMSVFPGPVAYERGRIAAVSAPPRASDCGPILRLVARQRKIALPFVLERLDAVDVEVRGWATHLLAELPYLEAVPLLLQRLRDDDPATATSAAISLAAVGRAFPDEVNDAVANMSHATDPRDRAAALRAMGELRDPGLVPDLIRGLGDGREEIVELAEWALSQVTRQDLGTDARRWLKWWEANALRHRIEWLIDGLTHEVSEIRRAAGEELKAITKEYFGYSADLPSRDRERAQQRYRDWWITEGKARFRRTS